MPIRTILSDVGGVLIENYDITDDVRRRVGLNDETFLPLWDRLRAAYGSGEIDEPTMWRTFADAGGNLVDISEDLFGTTFGDRLAPYPEVATLMNELGNQGYKLAILSDTNPNHQKILQAAGVYDPFGKNVFLSHEIGHRKPSAEAYQYALRSLSVEDPATVLFVDDSLVNVEGARDVGLQALHVNGDGPTIARGITDFLKTQP